MVCWMYQGCILQQAMSKGALESWTPEDMYVRLNEVFKSMRRALLGGNKTTMCALYTQFPFLYDPVSLCCGAHCRA